VVVVVVVVSKTGCRTTAEVGMTTAATAARGTIAIETVATTAVEWAVTTGTGAAARVAIAREVVLINNGIFGLATATPKKIVAVAMSGQLVNRYPSMAITPL